MGININIFEDIKIFLPQYLSAESQNNLFEELKSFPYNLDKRFYSDLTRVEHKLFQGDGLKEMFVTHLPETEFKKTNVIILSNSCDIDIENKRFSTINMIYCPLIELNKYEKYLNSLKFDENRIKDHINCIKRQEYTSMFFLPKNDSLNDDCVAVLDKANNINPKKIDISELCKNKLFFLSNYAFYMFLIKLSIHFTRMMEGIDRN